MLARKPMLSLNPDQKLSRIAGDLENSGACALLLIDTASLAGIERRYGAAAHHQMVLTKQAKQVKCPISGKPCKPAISSKVAGVDVYFCCKHCKETIDKAEDDKAKIKLVFNDKNFKQGFKVKSKKKETES